MIIKSFTAESAASALKKVRQAMGGDALVLKIRQIPDAAPDCRLEVTALLDKSSVATASTLLADRRPDASDRKTAVADDMETSVAPETADREIKLAQTPKVEEVSPTTEPDARPDEDHSRLGEIDRKLSQLLRYNQVAVPGGHTKLYRKLIDADLPDSYAQDVINRAIEKCDHPTQLADTLCELITDDLSERILPGLEFEPGDRVLLVGPTASGKTSALGKLAARLVVSGQRKVALATIDNFKIGAYDEIQSYAELLSLKVVDPFNDEAMEALDTETIILIDTPAVPTQDDKLEALKARVESVKPTHILATFSALTRTSDTKILMERMKKLSPTHLIVTLMDQTERYGSVLTACQKGDLKLVWGTNTPGGMGAINTLEPSELAAAIMNREVDDE